ncbi:MAG: hypothetical protein WKF84_16640 [Pyrinomonadaceae bacterium]
MSQPIRLARALPLPLLLRLRHLKHLRYRKPAPTSASHRQPGRHRTTRITAQKWMMMKTPASYTSFLMSIASNAAASLGLMEHPGTGAAGRRFAAGEASD